MEKIKFDMAALLFCITALGYAITYTYELGFIQYYQLPTFFVNMDLATIIRNSILLAIAIVPGLLISVFYEESDIRKLINNVNKIPDKKSLNFFIQFLFILGTAISFILWQKSGEDFHYVYTPLFVIFIFLYVLNKRYIQASVVTFIATILIISYSAGYVEAKNKDRYLHIPETDLIVIDYFDKNAILAKVDLDKKVIFPEYQLINVETSEIDTLKLELINTGKLKVKKNICK